jgi:hypothetical protein
MCTEDYWQILDYSLDLKFADKTAVLQLGQISWSVWPWKFILGEFNIG